MRIGLGGAALVGLYAGGAAYGILAASSAGAGRRVLSSAEVALLEALAEAYFPPGNAIGVDGRDVDVVTPLDVWVASMAPSEQRVVRSLLRLIDLWPRLSLGGFGRFSGLSLEDRVAVLIAFEESALEPRRAIGQLVRGLVSFPYFEDPRVLHGIGVEYGCPVPLLVAEPGAPEIVPDVAAEGQGAAP